MAKSNVEIVTTGLDVLLKGLRPYILRELKSKYKDRWWNASVKDSLHGTVGSEARYAQMTDEQRFELLDVQALLTVMNNVWNDVFQDQLGYSGRSYVSELREVRNSWAHQRAFNAEDAFRALDTIGRLLTMVGSPGQEEIKKLSQDLLRQRFEAETKKELKQSAADTQTGPLNGLKPWRTIATPHPDVASGRYQQAEFAADLFQVITGKAEPEYGDAKEFFRRTYLTEGLTRLLSRAWARLAGAGGDPVVELQTNFGGGKTHSLLALYHLFGGDQQLVNIPDLDTLVPAELQDQERVMLPKARRAVLVGTQLSPATPYTKPDGIEINTLWGEMAWQLGQAAGDAASAYAIVAEEDRKGVSPGSEKLALLFQQYGPALVLVDEWVAYARQIYGKEGLPSGNFDSNMTFAQALTEAAKAVKNTLVVVAIPASDIEIGGEGGRAALERIQNVFSRVESVWKPATASESFEIVRRRLFQSISDYPARDAVCRAFTELYQSNRAEFPSECREASYEQRLCSAYPIHPELFDRLYEDWSTLDRFQRTRGVLRLMASIIHELWERQDGSLLIMPGTLPIDSTAVRFEITRYLPEGWGAVLDKDVDGPHSRPLTLDRENPNLGRYSACRRVARTVFMGSAPSVSTQRVRGVEEVRIKLGCIQPGETPAVFGDALRHLSEDLTYLYSDASRYWFDTRPTITRMASDRAAQYERKPHMVEDDIVRRVKDLVKKDRGEFSGVHTIPADSSEVPDECACRLVILSPLTPHRARSEESKSIVAAQEILERRGNSPRIYRNMLIFLAADSERLTELEQAVRSWLAWTSIQQEEDQLNLDAAQKRQVSTQIQKNEETIQARLLETYCCLLIPTQEGTGPIQWTSSRLQGGENLVGRVSKKLKNDQQMITEWSPALLRMELDRWLWKDQPHLSVKQLWEYIAQYLYLSRLRDEQVLIAAIRNGVGSLTWKDYFSYASAVRDDGYYVGLVAGSLPAVTIDKSSVLVKSDIAQRQRDEESERERERVYGSSESVTEGEHKCGDGGEEYSTEESVEQPGKVILHRFHGTVDLDSTRLGRDAGRISDEVLTHLTSLVGAKAKITLEIDVEVPEGIPEEKIRIISENCNTLKFKGHGFEE
jgi:predicted AAA+ superfamily ATPase